MKTFIFLDEAGQEMEESLRAQRGPRTMFSVGPPLNVILRGLIAKSVQWAQNF